MKATSSLRAAVSAAAITAGLIFSGAGVVQFAGVTQAVAAVVSNISVRGNERVEAATIRDYVGIVPGRQFSNADIDEAVKRLFATGLFSDVRITQSGGTLVVQVAEYAIVNQVVFRGNRRVRDNQLVAATRLQPRSAYSEAALQSDVEGIRAAYARTGRGDVVITYDVVNIGGNRVNIIYDIQEGGRTKIGSINFVGNSAFSDGRLRDVITTKQSNILSWLTRNDIYDEDRLRADEEALRRFYYNRGYADFYVVSSFGELDEVRNEYTITFTVDEGERYSYGSIEIESTIPGVDSANLRRLLSTREGGTYRANEVENSLEALAEAHRRFATGTYMIWYPLKDPAVSGEFLERLAADGPPKTLALELQVTATDPMRMTGSGMILVNPPFVLTETGTDGKSAALSLLDWLAAALAQGPGARAREEWLTA